MADKLITDAGVIEQIRNAMPEVDSTGKGLMSAGIYRTIIRRYMNSGETIDIGNFNGFAFVKNGNSWGGQCVFWVSYDKAVLVAGPGWSTAISIEKSGDSFIIHYTGSSRIGMTALFLHIPMISMT